MTTPTPNKLKVTRYFSSANTHPYDEIEWEKRDVTQTNWKTGETIFDQKQVEFPKFWSLNASTIATTKYFRGALGTPARETSLRQVIDRVADTYAQAAVDNNYMSEADANIFNEELKWLLVNQHFAFNSPVWFNVGTKDPQQISACFILSVDDTMDSILNWYREEGLIFKGGSGAGVNLSSLRSSKELLRNSGGQASGPVSFMRGADASAGTIKSGGSCLAPWTLVRTSGGARRVDELSQSGEDFVAFAYNPTLGRVQAVNARAFEAGVKKLVQVSTDKGLFTMSEDHPVMLRGNMGYVSAGELTPGMSIMPGTISRNDLGYERIGLHDGSKGKESLHRLVAKDILSDGTLPEDAEVHHRDRNPRNNTPENLHIASNRAEHLRIHAAEDFANGTHPLQRFHGKGNHPGVAGDKNGMSHASGNRTPEYSAARDAGMRAAGAYELGQKAAATQRMMNVAYRIVNNGSSIDTFEEYFAGRLALAGKMGYSKAEQLEKIVKRFGSYEQFRDQVRAENHRVVSVTPLNTSVVYDVEVDSDTPEDRSVNDGHNFLIMSETPRSTNSETGIFVHNTRRAAKMVVLDVDHPDIEEFIETKVNEEKKIRALRDAGFDMDLGGKDIVSVQYQNANNSVRITDEFMHAVEAGDTYDLTARMDGEVIETVDSRTLFRKIASAAWECADPGVQFKDTINNWHTLTNTGPITASNPCSEYLSIDNSSCNLASLNLAKFTNEDHTFNVEKFVKAVELIITAMDISICFGHFPTKAIGDNTRKFRQLGIGFSGLGALLMSRGLPYDSSEGRALAGAITSLMSAVSYRRSAELAGIVGPYQGYRTNAKPHQRVMKKHRAASNALVNELRGEGAGFVAEGVVGAQPQAASIAEVGHREWEQSIEIGEKNGYRNSQASLIAPTGTISFFMDSEESLSIEPSFALVQFKKLVGGGSLQIVGTSAARGLVSLGYGQDTVEGIKAYILENGNVVGAPGLKEEDYAVFDCAVGERYISPAGHLKMMAACQPFLSGAISKTVNLPETVTVEDVEETYMFGWKLGLKAIAVYRDNCKVGQPLSDAKAKKTETVVTDAGEVREVVKYIERPKRERLPRQRDAKTTSFKIGANTEGYLTTGEFEDGRLGEMFLQVGRAGSTLSGMMGAFSVVTSLALQYGVPVEVLVEKFAGLRFEPAGVTDDPDLKLSQSILDYAFKRIALDYMDVEERQEVFGLYTTAERIAMVNGHEENVELDASDEIGKSAVAAAQLHKETKKTVSSSINEGGDTSKKETVSRPKQDGDAKECSTCQGTNLRRSGACMICEDCGTTSGCS